MKAFLYVGLGGFLGANLRYFVCDWAVKKWGQQMHYGTLMVNIAGSFLIGFLVMFLAKQFAISPQLKQLLITGFLGGFTTLSSLMLEVVEMLSKGEVSHSLFYLLVTILLCAVAVIGGSALAGRFVHNPMLTQA